jgi:hypothetical protein
MPKKKHTRTPEQDREAFIAAAREHGCDKSEAFDATVRQLAEQKPEAKPAKRKKAEQD